MDTSAPADFHSRVRRQIRDDALDAAYRLVEEQGWGAVRMTAIATAVGVSRQTLYKEFRSKEQLGEALLLREAQWFIAGVTEEIQRHTDVVAAIEACLRFGIGRGTANPLLRAVLSSPLKDDDTLLPLMTTGSEPLIVLAGQVMKDYITSRAPDLDPKDVQVTADALVRLLVSHLLLPLDDQETIVSNLTHLAARGLRLSP
ncbi:TetR/AcrR family transcriptional regulator [Actinomadura craniellae]|uniref:TetR/AcrR family transcriptional regulator n=1 Tax=Actinomadura craniellae TaxID=2231787 RepID=A0A365GVI9_9ACTN|nr:TetR family transcriptional regulator [Actinomadura craniellae]RAY10804.1 TetR/AcrR family transcriptional regulator [Actinomadura craniellae]